MKRNRRVQRWKRLPKKPLCSEFALSISDPYCLKGTFSVYPMQFYIELYKTASVHIIQLKIECLPSLLSFSSNMF